MAPSQVARGLFGHLVWLLGQGSISGNSQVCGGSFAAPGDRAGWRLHCWEGVTSPGQEGPQGQPGSVPWGLHCLELLPTPRTWGWPSTPWHLQGTGLGMSQVPRWWHRLCLPHVGSAENHCILKMRGQVKSCASLGDPRRAPELLAWHTQGQTGRADPELSRSCSSYKPFLHGELALTCCVGLQLGHGRGIPLGLSSAVWFSVRSILLG